MGSKLTKVIVGGVGGAAGALAMIYFFMYAMSTHTPQPQALTGSFSTVKGEHRCEMLPEGSRVCLNTRSVVRYVYSSVARNIELISGEASFEVRNDPRPFDVLAGGLIVHDLSTSFDVYRKSGSTLVTVIQGRVRVVVAPVDSNSRAEFNRAQPESGWRTAQEYHRLQQVEFDEATGKLRERHSLTEYGLVQLLAWQRGRIDLTGKPLSEALGEFARYQAIEEFSYQDKTLPQLRVGGELEATHLTDFLDSLAHVYGIQHKFTRGADGQTVVALSRPRNAGTHSQSH